MTQPCNSAAMKRFGNSYVQASYVKYLEAAGSRVVGLPYDAKGDDLLYYLNSLNSVLFPGGGASVESLIDIFTAVLNYSKSSFDDGKIFPVFGTCMGFQLLVCAQAQADVLSLYDGKDYTTNLHFTPLASTSRTFNQASDRVMELLAKGNVTQNHHSYGVKPSTMTNPKLSSFFKILSTSFDTTGAEFVSCIEGSKYPIYGTQFHPEKVFFNWNPHYTANHSAPSLYANRHFQDFLIGEAQKSMNHFPTKEEEKHIVWSAARLEMVGTTQYFFFP